jgi:hypothetical protein
MYLDSTCFFLSIQLQLYSHRIYVLLSEVKGRGDRIDGANLKDSALGNSFPLMAKYFHHQGLVQKHLTRRKRLLQHSTYMCLTHTFFENLCFLMASRCINWIGCRSIYWFHFLYPCYTELFLQNWVTNSWQMTNVTHKFLSMYLFLFITLYMFRAHRAHHQERQIVAIQPLVTVTLCWWPCRVQVGSLLPTCTRHGHQHG